MMPPKIIGQSLCHGGSKRTTTTTTSLYPTLRRANNLLVVLLLVGYGSSFGLVVDSQLPGATKREPERQSSLRRSHTSSTSRQPFARTGDPNDFQKEGPDHRRRLASSVPSSSLSPTGAATTTTPSSSFLPSLSPSPLLTSMPSESQAPSISARPSSSLAPSLTSLPSESQAPSISSRPSSSLAPSFTSMPSESQASSRPSSSSAPSLTPIPSKSHAPSISSQPSSSLAPSFTSMPSESQAPSISSRPSSSSAPSLTPMPSKSQAPSISSQPSSSLAPSFTSMPSESQAPSISSRPSFSSAPSLSSMPSESQAPSISSRPSSSSAPSLTLMPSQSQAPSISSRPSSSSAPSLTLMPSQSQAPSISSRPSSSLAPSLTLMPSQSQVPSVSSRPSSSSFPSSSIPTSFSPRTWQLVGGPFTKNDESASTMFGHSVALVGDYLAIGVPGTGLSSAGGVEIQKRLNQTNWRFNSSLNVLTETGKFGFALDAAKVMGNQTSILVGAVDTLNSVTIGGDIYTNKYGSAHFFQLDEATGEWVPLGNDEGLRPGLGITEVGGKFGTAVTMATDIYRVAVGAPSSSVSVSLLDTGRVYIFDFNETANDWQPMTAEPLTGGESNELLGASLSMSKDGNRLLVGAPGYRNGDGAIFYYEWNGSEWETIVSFAGRMSEGVGTTVAILDDFGTLIAFGAPDYDDGTGTQRGLVQVFQEVAPFFFAELGESQDFATSGSAAEGDRIGRTLAGSNGRVCFGTDNGSFRMYEYDEIAGSWVQVGTEPATLGFTSPVVSIAVLSSDDNLVAIGTANQEVAVFSLLSE